MTKKNYINVALFVLLIIFQISFILIDTVWLKTLTSLCFVFTAFIHLYDVEPQKKFVPALITAGLLWSLAGDISIEYNLVIGGICFGIAHLLYCISFFKIEKLNKKIIPVWAILFLIPNLIMSFVPFLDMSDPSMRLLGVGYSFILSVMTAKAIGNQMTVKSTMTLLLCIGAFIFYLSDYMVLFNHFNTGSGVIYRNIGHVLYFPAQFFIAQSIKHYK